MQSQMINKVKPVKQTITEWKQLKQIIPYQFIQRNVTPKLMNLWNSGIMGKIYTLLFLIFFLYIIYFISQNEFLKNKLIPLLLGVKESPVIKNDNLSSIIIYKAVVVLDPKNGTEKRGHGHAVRGIIFKKKDNTEVIVPEGFTVNSEYEISSFDLNDKYIKSINGKSINGHTTELNLILSNNRSLEIDEKKISTIFSDYESQFSSINMIQGQTFSIKYQIYGKEKSFKIIEINVNNNINNHINDHTEDNHEH